MLAGRKYRVEMINNVERKTSHESESQMVGKVVVTCEVSIYSLGTHSGIGEEWAEKENSGTAAEALSGGAQKRTQFRRVRREPGRVDPLLKALAKRGDCGEHRRGITGNYKTC
jgi:hypothetical protein